MCSSHLGFVYAVCVKIIFSEKRIEFDSFRHCCLFVREFFLIKIFIYFTNYSSFYFLENLLKIINNDTFQMWHSMLNSILRHFYAAAHNSILCSVTFDWFSEFILFAVTVIV